MGYPAQYHFFKHTIRRLMAEGIEVKLVIKTKDVLESLLREDGLYYINVQEKMRKNDKLSILMASLQRSWEVIKISRKFKPDLLLGSGADVAHAGWLFRKPCVTTLEDDIDIIRNLTRLTYPFTKNILVPIPCKVGRWEEKKIGYAGYMKLAYLHPNEFTPDREIISRYDLPERYVLIRLVRLTAYHDVHIKGLNPQLVEQLIHLAEKNGYRPYISSEGELLPQFRSYQLKIKSTDIHHVMAYASLLISDSQSMSIEASMLGVPNIRFNDTVGKISVLQELEEWYRLTIGIPTSDPSQLIKKTEQCLSNPETRALFAERKAQLLREKIDVTAFLTWFIKNYPERRQQMKSNPDTQYQFK